MNFVRHRVTPDIWPTSLKILLKNLPRFDWHYIKSYQIGIKRVSGCVILNLGYHLCLASLIHTVSRIKWSQRGVNINSILFSGKINFPLLIFQRWIASEKCHFLTNHICHSTSFYQLFLATIVSCILRHNHWIPFRYMYLYNFLSLSVSIYLSI